MGSVCSSAPPPPSPERSYTPSPAVRAALTRIEVKLGRVLDDVRHIKVMQHPVADDHVGADNADDDDQRCRSARSGCGTNGDNAGIAAAVSRARELTRELARVVMADAPAADDAECALEALRAQLGVLLDCDVALLARALLGGHSRRRR